ncbi:hypothetical protein B0H10DRAFT_2102854 [Mycena sp. CBHHK59/15]|nr:hypothetical protein B0H10DRAFT_2102854 [Mycena sp. CBHHK59/15]
MICGFNWKLGSVGVSFFFFFLNLAAMPMWYINHIFLGIRCASKLLHAAHIDRFAAKSPSEVPRIKPCGPCGGEAKRWHPIAPH